MCLPMSYTIIDRCINILADCTGYYVMLYLSNKTFKYNTLIIYVKLVFCVFLPILLPLCASTCHVSDAEHYIPPPF